jgi:hypothetical protein
MKRKEPTVAPGKGKEKPTMPDARSLRPAGVTARCRAVDLEGANGSPFAKEAPLQKAVIRADESETNERERERASVRNTQGNRERERHTHREAKREARPTRDGKAGKARRNEEKEAHGTGGPFVD